MNRFPPSRLAFLLFVSAPLALSQTIHVDATPSHSTNTIKPTEALGAGIDRLGYGAADKLYVADTIQKVLSAGWQTMTYRQNTELHMEAWHWNPEGTWSDPGGKATSPASHSRPRTRFVTPTATPCPHRGVTRDDGTDTVGYSRLTDGDPDTYWKSNPYLAEPYTGEDDSLHPQWVHHRSRQASRQSRPFASTGLSLTPRITSFSISDRRRRMRKPTSGVWQAFPGGTITNGKGGDGDSPTRRQRISAQYLRILMTASSNTCDSHGSADKRNCLGYAIREIYVGTTPPTASSTI